MKKFKFRFQTVLDIREKELEKAELKVAEAQKVLLDTKQQLIDFQNDLKKTKQTLETLLEQKQRIDISIVNNYHNYIRLLEKKVVDQHKLIREKEKELDRVRKEMLLIRQKKLMLDKLKEKDWREYIKESDRQDLQMIDEIANTRFTRK